MTCTGFAGDCTSSGCCSVGGQHCFVKDPFLSRCMHGCVPTGSLRGWSCVVHEKDDRSQPASFCTAKYDGARDELGPVKRHHSLARPFSRECARLVARRGESARIHTAARATRSATMRVQITQSAWERERAMASGRT